ncbi:MAG: NADH-quinone oxidoreductase subunit [Bacteroidales bacterium]|nr:NADH-quinone oxidoreductase subunit [Bacteroidales bacterium]MDN5330298.1 NADH-quinone oxidoreductase subunit [Bacteroidales bacterium]
MLFTIEVNGQQITARRGETILECLLRNGIKVPTLCHMDGYSPTGACRICMVEVEGRNELIPSCSHPVEEWMKIKTHSPKVIRARKANVELLLSNHPDECLYCERNGSCELQNLAFDLNIRERRFNGQKHEYKKDYASPAILRDPSKCILCGRCVRLCETEQAVGAIDFYGRGNTMMIGTSYNHCLSIKNCHNCGQCVLVCPTGALYERQHIPKVQELLHKPEARVLAHLSPTVAASVASAFGLRSGKDLAGLIAAALLKIGFFKVYDTSAAIDIHIMENAALLKKRLEAGENFPLFSSCCPAWVHYFETFYPHMLKHLSPVLSPMQIMGSMLKKNSGTEAANNYVVGIMPCTAKKHEMQRPEMYKGTGMLTDAVLTTRELINLIKLHGVDLENIDPVLPNAPYHVRSTAARLYGVSGGAAEAIARTLFFMLTGQELEPIRINELRNGNLRREVKIKAGKTRIGFVAVSTIKEARKLMDEILGGRRDIHFVEVMACPGGCINGGGQPIGADEKDLKLRVKSLYETDERENIRVAHKSPLVNELYQKQFEYPGSPSACEFFHKAKNQA